MEQSSGRSNSEGGSYSEDADKGPSAQTDVRGEGSIVTPATPNSKLFLVKCDFTAQGEGQLTVHRGEKLKVMEFNTEGAWVEGSNSRGEVGWLPASCIVQCDSLEEFSWYHGNITCTAAELTLSCGKNGSFLISKHTSGQHRLSLRFNKCSHHYLICQDRETNKYYVRDPMFSKPKELVMFPTLQELVGYYSQHDDGLVCTLLYPAPNIFGLLQVDKWEINRSDIKMGQKLEGEPHEDMYIGTYLKTGQSVAVKTFSEEKTDEFLKEAAVMKKVQHAHLVQLLGVCTQEVPFFIVTENMPKGNLLDYIQGPEGHNLDAVTLVYMSQQIASAMAYLEEKDCIHRHLTAQNCLVGNENLVKVAIFQLSQLMENVVYVAPASAMFDSKRTAPEVLLENKFSIKSDIWSFGILLWELASRGKTPYAHKNDDRILKRLSKGYRLKHPKGCPSKIYDMMKRCWEWNPQQRPQFAELNQELMAMPNVIEGFKESECSALYHKAIKDNPTITLHIAKAMTIGPPQVGKTSLRHHLLGLPPPEISPSTPVMKVADILSMGQSDCTSPDEVSLVASSGAVQSDHSPDADNELSSGDSDNDLSQIVFKRSRCEPHMYIADGKKWVLVNSANGMLSLLNFLQQKVDIAPTQPPQSSMVLEGRCFKEPNQPLSVISLPVENSSKSVANVIRPIHGEVQESDVANDTLPDSHFEAHRLHEKNPVSVANVIRQLYNELQKPDITDITLPDAHLLQFLDCGGQLAYHDILPLFVNIPAIYLHVFNMTKELTECPIDELCSTKGEKKYSSKSALSVVEMIKRSVMTVHSLADKKFQLPSKVKTHESKTPEPHILLVGTHLDKLGKAQQNAKLEAINETLQIALHSKSHDLEGMVVKDPKHSRMFFPVNNMSRKSCNLRKRIREQAKEDAVKVEVPVKWYLRQLLEMSQGEEKPLYLYSELYQRCKGEGSVADIGEFHAMVTYFHALGLLIHLCAADVRHTEDSDCLVFTNPSYLFENISKLYQVQFEEVVQGRGKIAFKHEGKLTKEALQSLGVDKDHLSHSVFMDLLIQLFIGAEIEVHEGVKTLFVPSVLTNAVEDASQSEVVSVPQEHPLCFAVTFKHTSFIPCGVFTGMIARLQSTPGWEICTSSISRTLMKFSVGALGTVKVLDHATHISVEIECCEELTHGHYQDYRDTIIRATAESYCFLFHSKNAKDPHSGTCRTCMDSPYLVLGQTCHWCPPQPGGTHKVQHFAELKIDIGVPMTVRCQETMKPKVLVDTSLEQVPFQNISYYAVVKEQHTNSGPEEVEVEMFSPHVALKTEVAKALEPQNNIQTCSLSPTLAKSNSPTQLESQLPPSLPGAKGTQPPPVNYRSKPGILQKPRPLSVPMFFQPQHQPSSPRLPQRPFSPSPDTCPKHTVYPTTVNQKTIAPQKGVQPPPPSSTCEAGIPCTETPLPPPVSPNEGLFRSTTMSSAQGQSSPWWKDRTAQGEEPFKPAPMPKPGRPTIPSKPNLQPSLASRTPPPVTQPKPKQTQVQNSLAHTCSSATHVQELTKDSVDHVEVAKALEPQNNIQTHPLSPTPAKSNSPTQFVSRPPPSLPGAKGTQPPPVDYRSKSSILQKPRPLSVPVFSQPQQQPSSPRLSQHPFFPSPDTCPKHTVYPTTVNQKTIAPLKGVQPPPPSSTCEAGIPCTETPLPPPVSPNEGLFRSATMSSAQGQSSPRRKDRTAQGEEPFKPAPMPKPGRPTIPSKPNLQPSLASRTPPPVTKPKQKQTQVQNSLAHTCSSATHVQELTKDSVDQIEVAKALEPQNNIQTCSLSPTPAKSNSPTQFVSRPPPSLPGVKGTQPPPVDYRSKSSTLRRPLSVHVFSQPQQQPSSPRLSQCPFSPSPDTCSKHTVYPTTVNQKTIAPLKGVQPPPPSSTCEAGIPCTEKPLPPPVSPNEGLFRSATMSSAQGQSSPRRKDRTAQGEEPFKPAPMPKPGRPSIASRPPLPAKPSVANRTPPKPKSKQTQVQDSLSRACSSAINVQELTKERVDHIAEQVLDLFWDRFIAEMDASVIVYNLEHHSLISDGDRKMLTKNMDAMQQNQILHAQLKNKCTTKALMDVCDIITAVKGNPKMIKLGEDMKKRLEKVGREQDADYFPP